MRDGAFVTPPVAWPLSGPEAQKLALSPNSGSGSNLHSIALSWLGEDRDVRRAGERAGTVKKTRGARVSLAIPHCA